MASGVVLFRRQSPHLTSSNKATVSFGHSERDVQQGRIETLCGDNSGDDMLAVLHGQPELVGCVLAADDGRRPVVTVPSKVEGPLTVLLCRPYGQVTGGAPSVPEQYWLWGTVG